MSDKFFVTRASELTEVMTDEQCYILENLGADASPNLSIARARVSPGVMTKWHRLSVDEIYIVVEGSGEMSVDAETEAVTKGDLVRIPRGSSQRIKNTGSEDLVFYCICTPAFTLDTYEDTEKEMGPKA
ncbi:MAG: cupin domain-containing protein [Candidatus Eisenbacteria bacterium]|uniref:Cupin domain-containing protein n=1 Tax=Eiseniibacteriota bacterium TaxID=2212470 RepID=A0A7Y2E5U5_UNCEI|nr:cupin domain-containing protein [Candidatus Eisenbacteria bacterium]